LGVAVLVVLAVAVGLVIRSHRLETRQEQTLRNPAGSPDSAEVIKGAVEERSLPDLLPEAQESIHGQFDVKVRVSVDPAGQVSNAELDLAGPSKYFARQALTAAQQWTFKPAQIKGKPVASAWILDFTFTQSGTDVTPVEVSP
jgi:TonB family protein